MISQITTQFAEHPRPHLDPSDKKSVCSAHPAAEDVAPFRLVSWLYNCVLGGWQPDKVIAPSSGQFQKHHCGISPAAADVTAFLLVSCLYNCVLGGWQFASNCTSASAQVQLTVQL